jgi:hypothetical protein
LTHINSFDEEMSEITRRMFLTGLSSEDC